jgi:NIPSNAP
MNAQTCCPVVELRQYTLVPGGREVLIALFEREFIETQEATGMTVIGQFRDLNNPDRFVWLRGFSDMTSRARQLQEFYGGPVWKRHRTAANATMIDSDNVLLLRPAFSTSGFHVEQARRPPHEATEHEAAGLLVASILNLVESSSANFAHFFRHEIQPQLAHAGISPLASFVTEKHPNTFPALPVREEANVFVWFAFFANRSAYEERAAAIFKAMHRNGTAEKLSEFMVGEPEALLLAPTARSLLRG